MIQKESRKKGDVWVVRVYDPTTLSKKKVKTFTREKDARAFEAQHTLAKRKGDLEALDAGKESLAEFEQEWWTHYAEQHLAAHTRRDYRRLIDKHILPELGRHQLRHINPRMLSTWAASLKTGGPTKRKVLAILQGIMERAVEWERIPSNPVKAVKKPGRNRARAPRVLVRGDVEQLRRSLASTRDSTLVAVLAYGGLRPSEALGLQFGDIGDRTLRVERAIALGDEKETKNRRVRIVELTDELRAVLRAWKLASGNRSGWVFPGRDGKPWSDTQYRNWRKRKFEPAAGKGVRPYDLRHTRASELFAAGKNPAWIAEQMGHTLQTLLSTYVHVIEEVGNKNGTSEELEAAES